MAGVELPYRVEYAKSGRAGCKEKIKCGKTIDKGELRLAILVQSRFHDGKDPNWYHFNCFFKKFKPLSVGDISHFESIRWEDQEKIRSEIAKYSAAGGSAAGTSSSSSTPKNGGTSSRKSSKKSASATATNYQNFQIEYAKSSRSVCFACEAKIEKDEIRISKLDFDSEKASFAAGGGIPRWHHVKCFVQVRDQLGFDSDAEPKQIPGFKALEKADQEDVAKQIKPSSSGKRKAKQVDSPIPSKQLKVEASTNGVDKKLAEQIKTQNAEMYKIRDKLESLHEKKVISKAYLIDMLTENGQEVPAGVERILDRLSDIMLFGALEKCPECKSGQYVYRSGVGYQCLGHISEFTSCQKVVQEPPRKNFVLPLPHEPKVAEAMEWYQFKGIGTRIIPKHDAPVEAKQLIKFAKLNKTPLKDFKIQICPESVDGTQMGTLTEKIKEFGGKVMKKSSSDVLLVVANDSEITSRPPSILYAEKREIPVVRQNFIGDINFTCNLAEVVKKNLISPWFPVDDVYKRLKKLNQNFEKSAKELEREGEKKVELTLKGGTVVDPDSELADQAHVYKRNGKIFSVALSLTDIDHNRNSYYKLQLLESDSGKTYHIFRSWGRIGTSIGGKSTSHSLSLREAELQFNELFTEKTGNVFGEPFHKKPDKYMMLELEHAPKEEAKQITTSKSSKLPMSVQEFICLIFDVNRMKETMMKFELDLKKMPLGKLSKTQIMEAYKVLSECSKILEKVGAGELKQDDRRIVDITNRFYTLIPHDCGADKLPTLSTKNLLLDKTEMLENLLEIEIAYDLLCEGEKGKGSSVDSHYAVLKCDIGSLEKNSEEFSLISKYLNNTHAPTHTDYTLNIKSIFKVQRKGERERYDPFKKFPNRQLLWHGSRVTNFVGILSQGLRIAPPEAPATGYMFGKGVYFADMVSKSANYCFSTRENPTGVLLLCEVALGNMMELKRATDITKLPKEYSSVKGLGQTEPDPTDFTFMEKDIKIPYGKPTNSKVKNSELLYNEYIVYDVNQVNLRYILQVDFDFKTRARR